MVQIMFPQGLYEMNITGQWIDEEYDRFLKRARWALKFVWWPKRCYFSGQVIWLKQAYKGTAGWQGPGPDAIEIQWATVPEFTFKRLQGMI